MILAIDTSMGTAVAVVGDDGDALAERLEPDVRSHAERIGELIAACLDEAGASPHDVTAVAVGMGPGPYTGLRVGVAAARAFALGRGVPILPVASHDAIREELGLAEDVAVATPAGRRGHYRSLDGRVELTHDGPGQAVQPEAVRAASLARVALARRASGLPTGPAEPLYLREPDIAPPSGRKRSLAQAAAPTDRSRPFGASR